MGTPLPTLNLQHLSFGDLTSPNHYFKHAKLKNVQIIREHALQVTIFLYFIKLFMVANNYYYDSPQNFDTSGDRSG